MDHEKAFLQAVCERPEDDTTRLVFADWLEQHGQSDRAEFIRLQCALPRRLGDREQELLRGHQAEWTLPLRRLVPELRDDDVRFTRGFPSAVTLRSADALAQAERLAKVAPVQEVRLYLGGEGIDAQGARTFFSSRGLRAVTYLYVAGSNRLDAETARALAESPHLRHLTHLSLPANAVGDLGASALAGLGNLTHLDLRINQITDAGAGALARSASLSNLTHLDLSDNRIGDEGARALLESLRSGPLSNVTSLDLDHNRISRNLLREIHRTMARHSRGMERGNW